MGKICDMDCFNCKFPDCVNDTIYPESARYCNWSEERKRKNRKYQTDRYRKALSEGLCGHCHNKPLYRGVLCYECWLKQKRYKASIAEQKREYRHENGLCYFCDTPVVPGKKSVKSTCISSKKVCHTLHNFTNLKNINGMPTKDCVMQSIVQNKNAMKIKTYRRFDNYDTRREYPQETA